MQHPLGLKPVRMVIWERKLNYFRRIANESFQGSDYVRECLEYHISMGDKSPYISELQKICKSLGTSLTPTLPVKKLIFDWGVKTVTDAVQAKKSLASCSMPKKWWKTMNYVNDSPTSKMIAEFRGGNIGVGDRDSSFSDNAFSTSEGRILVCPGCGSGFLCPSHIVVSCSGMTEFRQEPCINGESLDDVFDKSGALSEKKKLMNFLNTTKDSYATIVEKAYTLDFLKCQFAAKYLINS